MHSYVKSVFFAVVFALLAWNITCFAPQGPAIIHKGGSSASFIQQESNLNVATPKTPIPQNNPTQTQVRDYVNPNLGNPSSSQQARPDSNLNPSPQNNRGGVRDYVNPNLGNPSSSQQARPNSNLNPSPQNNRGGVRDYVNPNLGNPSSSQQARPTNSNVNQATSTIIKPPSPQNNRGGVRDYVNPQNPNMRTPRPEFPGLPQPNQRNPTPNFPGLPARPPTGNTVATTPISYANKVSGGATTKSPIPPGSPISSGPHISPGPQTPPGSSTEKPDEGPTDTELREFSEALLRRDVNNAGKYVTVNLQGKTTSQSKNDEAPQKLLEVKPEAFQISTISKLKLLHNNYILDTNENEHVTAQEKAEENDLLEAMLTTPIMQYTKNFLIAKGKITRDPRDFKDLLKLLWFNMYSRGGGRIGSSGFEHIFLAELKKNEVSGLHNWVYFDQAEINKIVDYLGYMKKIDLGEKGQILKFHFKLNGVDKPVDSMFIGTSPELEVALYTTCYLFRVDKICPLKLNGNNFIVRTYNYRYRGKNMIGSAFPEI